MRQECSPLRSQVRAPHAPRARGGRDVAGLRLLTVVLPVLVSLGVAARCEGKPFVAPRIAGRIVDKRTGQPVAGMTVFVWYEYSVTWSAEPKGGGFGDALAGDRRGGALRLPGAGGGGERVTAGAGVVEARVRLLHRDYGSPEVDPAQRPHAVVERGVPDRAGSDDAGVDSRVAVRRPLWRTLE